MPTIKKLIQSEINSSSPYANDDEIILAIRTGDMQAFKYLYKSKYLLIKKMILSKGGKEEDVKDIYQETMSAFYKNVKKTTFHLSSSISTYLYSIAKNHWLKEIDRRMKLKENSLTEREHQVVDTTVINIEPTEEEIRIRAIKIAIKKLKDPCQTLLSKYYFEKKSMQEIADEMGYKSAKVAKGAKYKCMERLRKATFKEMKK